MRSFPILSKQDLKDNTANRIHTECIPQHLPLPILPLPGGKPLKELELNR